MHCAVKKVSRRMSGANSDDRIYIAGHSGMVGSAIARRVGEAGISDLVVRGQDELDLVNQQDVFDFFADTSPTHVYVAAAKVGGIHANNIYPAEFIYQNLMIEANIIHAAWKMNVKRLLFLGSSCIYPRLAKQPMGEDSLLTGPLEPTNEPYAIAKIAGIKLCESYRRQYGCDFRSVMPTNLYGPGDNFHPENSHVIPALLRRFHEAKLANTPQVVVWGSGKPKREFLFVEDLAEACVFVMQLASSEYGEHTQPMLSHLNIGTGQDCSIAELALTIADVVGYPGKIVFDSSKPDGAPRKLLDVSRMASLGWYYRTKLRDGLQQTYAWFLEHGNHARR